MINDIPEEENLFDYIYLSLEEDQEFKINYKILNNNKKCIVWLPGRNDYFYHYHISSLIPDYDIFVINYRNNHEKRKGIPHYFYDLGDIFEEIDLTYEYFKINKYDEVVLYGHSTGGLISIVYQQHTDNKITKLLLNSPFLKYKFNMCDYCYFNYFIYYLIPCLPEFNISSKVYSNNEYTIMLSEKFNINYILKSNINLPVISTWFRNLIKYQNLIKSNNFKVKYPTLILYSDHHCKGEFNYVGDSVLDIKKNVEQIQFLGNLCSLKTIKNAVHDVLLSYYDEVRKESIDEFLNFLS